MVSKGELMHVSTKGRRMSSIVNKALMLLSVTAMVSSGCKQRTVKGSSTKDAIVVNETTLYGIFQFVGGRSMQFYKSDGPNNNVERDASGNPVIAVYAKDTTKQRNHAVDPSGGQLIIYKAETKTGATFPPVAENIAVNYGWSENTWPCNDGYELLDEIDRIVPGDTSLCRIEFNTEDKQQYTVLVAPTKRDNFAQRPDSKLREFLNKYKKPVLTATMDAKVPTGAADNGNPLKPMVDLNVAVDKEFVLTAMVDLHNEFQVNSDKNKALEAKKQRNTCLKNARAHEWLDLQAHFYCILPYEPHRSCYSLSLIEGTKDINLVTDPQKKVAQLLGAYWSSYAKCIAPAASAPGAKPLAPNTASVFKYIMFTKQGLMDFNIDSESETIEEFYTKVGEGGTLRPSRVTDVSPWSENQARYNKIRLTQATLIKGSLSKSGCAKSGGTWDATAKSCNCGNGNFNAETFECETAAVVDPDAPADTTNPAN